MTGIAFPHVLWALTLGAVSAASLPLGSLLGLKVRFSQRSIAAFGAFGAGALIAALSVELVAPTSLAVTEERRVGSTSHAQVNFIALILGGTVGGTLFVALDTVVNQKGGYLRKMATTMAHMAARRREEVSRKLMGVLEMPPFNGLPGDLTETLVACFQPKRFRHNEMLWDPDDEFAEAYIVVEGELGIEIEGRQTEVAGPGTIVGVLALFVPQLASLCTVKAKTDGKCLVLKREEMNRLRALSPAFDKACRDLASERMERIEQHLITRLSQAVEWTRSAAGALRMGTEVPELTIRRAHAVHRGSPLAVWLGILLDGVPESLVIGAGLYTVIAAHPAVETLRFIEVIPYTLVAGLFLSNFPEALSSAANMLAVGLPGRRIFLMWFSLMVITALGAGLGFLLASLLSETWLVFAEGVAAGAMLTMIAAAMIPEAAAHGRPSAVGLSTLGGFLAAVCFKWFE